MTLRNAAKSVFQNDVSTTMLRDYAAKLAAELISLGYTPWSKTVGKGTGELERKGIADIVSTGDNQVTLFSLTEGTTLQLTFDKNEICFWTGTVTYDDGDRLNRLDNRITAKFKWTDTEKLSQRIASWILEDASPKVVNNLLPPEQRKSTLPELTLTAR